MKSRYFHPGKLLSIWNELEVTGECIKTKKWLTFPYGHILWEKEGEVDNGIPVYFWNAGISEEIPVDKDSMRLIFPDMEKLTPLHRLALSALPLAHWHPEQNDN